MNTYNILPAFSSQFSEQKDNPFPLLVDLDIIRNSVHLPQCIRVLALDLQNFSYVTTGAFFAGLSNESAAELYSLAELVETKERKVYFFADNKATQALEALAVLALMLMKGEGATTGTSAEIQIAVSALTCIILTEILFRFKKTVVLQRNNYSLLCTSAIIAVPVNPPRK